MGPGPDTAERASSTAPGACSTDRGLTDPGEDGWLVTEVTNQHANSRSQTHQMGRNGRLASDLHPDRGTARERHHRRIAARGVADPVDQRVRELPSGESG